MRFINHRTDTTSKTFYELYIYIVCDRVFRSCKKDTYLSLHNLACGLGVVSWLGQQLNYLPSCFFPVEPILVSVFLSLFLCWKVLLFHKCGNVACCFVVFERSQQISSYLLPIPYIFLILWQSQFFNREQTNSFIVLIGSKLNLST